MAKRALITGIRGQDGGYLAKLLLKKGYEVYGGDRRSGGSTAWRLDSLGIKDEIELVYLDLFELTNIIRVLEEVRPHEVYNLAAQSFVGVSFEQPILTAEVNAIGVLRVLEAIRTVNKDIRLYQASTSEMFGNDSDNILKSSSKFQPRSPYAFSKVLGHQAVETYREAHDIFGSSGILFNHESPLRGDEFVTQKIAKGVAEINSGREEPIRLGNIDAKRDWGYAPEYVEAMWKMMQKDEPMTCTVGTGKSYSVREFTEFAFQSIGVEVEWSGAGTNEVGVESESGERVVEVSEEYYRPVDVDVLEADTSEAVDKLGWRASTECPGLARIMTQAHKERLQS